MQKCLLFFIVLFFCTISLYSQRKTWESFLLPGHVLLDSVSGDINRDGKKDMLLILKNNEEETNMDTTRPLLLLFGEDNDLYELAARNDSVVLCRGCGGVFGDPYAGLTVKNNFFSIEHYGGSNWRWTRVITFRYDVKTKKIFLHRDAGESFHIEDPEKTNPYTYTKEDYGRLLFSNYSYDKIWRQ